MQLISYRGEPVAIVFDGDRAGFVPSLEARGLDDPLLRFAAGDVPVRDGVRAGTRAGTVHRRACPSCTRASR